MRVTSYSDYSLYFGGGGGSRWRPHRITTMRTVSKTRHIYKVSFLQSGRVNESAVSGLGFEHDLSKTGIDGVDVLEGCLFLLVSEDFL
jgi:hypothetical protein